MAKDYKVKLVRASTANLGTQSNGLERVTFDVTPDFTESRSASYRNIDAVHAPGQIFLYGMTNSRTFSISGKLISRSPNEATKNLTYVSYLRSWMMPVFGTAAPDSNGQNKGLNILGAPPPILLLSAYAASAAKDSNDPIDGSVIGSTNEGKIPSIGNNIFQVPVVMTNLEVPYPSDVDYIPTVTNIPFPTIMNVSISLTETHSPGGYQQFSIVDYKNGNLLNF